MGIKSDIRWLKEADERVNIFILIARKGPLKIRELKKSSKSEDWWPVKYNVNELIDRELIEQVEEGYSITESGRKVVESLKTVYDIESV